MRRILVLLPINRIILSIWLRITDHIFHRQGNRKAVWTSIVIGMLSAWSLFAYPTILSYIQQSQADYTQLANYPSRLIPTLLGLYVLLIVTIDTFLTHRLRPTRRVIKNFLVLLGVVAISFFLLWTFSVEHIILYYLLVAFSEEALKYLWALTMFDKWRLSSSDVVLFSFLTVLWFAFFENILYVVESANAGSSRLRQIAGGSWLLIARGVVGFDVHLLFTWTIAYLTTKIISEKKSFLNLIPAFAIWLLLHLSYNLALQRNGTIAILIFVVGWYALLSFLFYKSDSMYLT